jgi:diguanylate cyclase
VSAPGENEITVAGAVSDPLQPVAAELIAVPLVPGEIAIDALVSDAALPAAEPLPNMPRASTVNAALADESFAPTPGLAQSSQSTTSASHIGRALLIISILSIAMMSLCAIVVSYYFLHDQTQRHLRTLIAFTASESTTALNFNDARVGEEILRAIPAAEGLSMAELRDASGQVLVQVRNNPGDILSHLAERLGSDRVSQDVVLDGKRIGSVTLEGGSGPLLRTMAGIFAFSIPVMFFVVLTSLMLARRYTRRITQPILQLRTVVQRLIQHRDFSQRAPPSELTEVEELRSEFNTLLDEIGLRDRLLTQTNDTLRRVAYVDALTGLPNRAMFEQALQRSTEICAKNGARASLFYLDIDAFKSINDNFGHSVGDTLLSEIGARLRAWPPATVAARIGGDEFVVLIAPLTAQQDICRLAADLQRALDAPLQLKGQTIYPGISIGAAVYPDMTGNVDELIKIADQAMYTAKDQRYRQSKATRWDSEFSQHG